ncbi:MAG TPA: PQQ-binding-like beta-propeller repeat protein [Acidobacteriota bacterium]|nr:PQQ-binding-like beta-propeller repeat protein [Acidobacteriota bacterium]
MHVMKYLSISFCVAVLLLQASLAVEEAGQGSSAVANWPQWRGPLGTGVAPDADPPIEWGENKNVRWKIELPGKGHSTPVIWGDRIFLTTALPYGEELEPVPVDARNAHDQVPVTQRHKFIVMAIERRKGEVLWQRTVREALPHEGGHITASLASASPVTDGELLFAFFGSWGLYCLDLDGNLKWKVDLGTMHPLHAHGEGSSPALYGDTLVVNWDHEGESFIVAFDKQTGKERWRKKRNVRSSSWSTPLVVDEGQKPQVIVSGSDRLTGYDLATGEIIWECGGMSVENVVATPVAEDGIVYAGSSYDRRAMLAIRYKGAKGDITGSHRVLWSRPRGAPYVPSPLLYGDSLYYHYHFQGVMTRVNARTGEDDPGPLRLSGIRMVFASPIGASGRVYVVDREGNALVLSHGDEPQALALNRLDDSFSASPVAVGRELYLRGERHLYCIAH